LSQETNRTYDQYSPLIYFDAKLTIGIRAIALLVFLTITLAPTSGRLFSSVTTPETLIGAFVCDPVSLASTKFEEVLQTHKARRHNSIFPKTVIDLINCFDCFFLAWYNCFDFLVDAHQIGIILP